MTRAAGSLQREKDNKVSFLHDSVALGNFEQGLVTVPVPNQTVNDSNAASSSATVGGGKENYNEDGHRRAEVERLPLLLRILSKSRPLTNVSLPPSLILDDEQQQQQQEHTEEETSPSKSETAEEELPDVDEVLEEAVRNLEDRAAAYSISESVEVVSVHLAPFVARGIAKLPPMRRKAGGVWEVQDLETVAQNPHGSRSRQSIGTGTISSSNFKRRKVHASTGKASSGARDPTPTADNNDKSATTTKDDLLIDSDEDMGDALEGEDAGGEARLFQSPGMPKRKRLASSGTTTGERDSILLATGAAEDSQEAFVSKTLSELTLLVVQYLKQENKFLASLQQQPSHLVCNAVAANEDDNNNGNDKNTPTSNKDKMETLAKSSSMAESSFSVEESILAQARMDSETDAGGGIIGTDLGATVASLFYHTTVMRHSHIAAALCVASQPQAPHLIRRLAANCPAAVPCLVRGCLDALIPRSSEHAPLQEGGETSDDTKTSALVATRNRLVYDSILTLSRLSDRERLRIQRTLRYATSSTSLLATSSINMLLTLQLEMALDRGESVELACFLIEHLPRSPFVTARNTDKEGTQKTDADAEEDDDADVIDTSKVSLATEIASNTEKWIPDIMQCLTEGMRDASLTKVTGKMCLLLRATLWLLVTQNKSTKSSMNMLLSSLVDIAESLQSELHKCELHCLLVSCMLFSCSDLLKSQNENRQEDDQLLEKTARQINQLWESVPSLKVKAFLGPVSCALQRSPDELQPVLNRFVLQYLGVCNDEELIACQRHKPGDETDLRKWSQSNLKLTATLEATIEEDPSTLLATLEWLPEYLSLDRLENVIASFLKNSLEHYSLQLLACREGFDLLEKSVYLLHGVDRQTLPIISPLLLERNASLFLTAQANTSTLDPPSASYLLQLVYCFVFKEMYPKSPFSFNPIATPLKQVWLVLHDTSNDEISAAIRSFLLQQIEKRAPVASELGRFQERIESFDQIIPRRVGGLVTKELLAMKIRSIMSNIGTEPCGKVTEGTVMQAFLVLGEQDFVSATASALLSGDTKSPLWFLSYLKLCEDPLAVTKTPCNTHWKHPGARKLLLFLLNILMNANSAILQRACSDGTTRKELIAVRDLLTLRCLVSSSFQLTLNQGCFWTTGLVRWIVINNRGLVASLFKQGLPHEEIDWLIDFIPEIINDAQYLMADLFAEEKVSLSSTERLVIADGVMRVMVLYGQRDESMTEALVVTCLAQLLGGFFLVLGPSGVAVSTLLSENDSKMDANKVSRRAALRILKHAALVRGYRSRIRSECAIALLKLHRMCKGEEVVSGLSVAIGGRQKGILREIQDAIAKALSSMGVVAG